MWFKDKLFSPERIQISETEPVCPEVSLCKHFFSDLCSLVCPQVTYRVVQVTDDHLDATADGTGAVSVVSTAAFTGAPQAVAQVSKRTSRLKQLERCLSSNPTTRKISFCYVLFCWLLSVPTFSGCYSESFQQWGQSCRGDGRRGDAICIFSCCNCQRWDSHSCVGAGHRRPDHHTGRRWGHRRDRWGEKI